MSVDSLRDDPEARKPWYKHFWLWFVLTPPIVSVFVGTSLVYTAFSHPDSLVIDDRIDVGRATHQKHERERLAGEMGIAADLVLEEGERVKVSLEYRERDAAPERLWLRLSHPTLESRDLELSMQSAGSGRYLAEWPVTAEPLGRRYVQMEPADREWRLVGELHAGAGGLRLEPRQPIFSATE